MTEAAAPAEERPLDRLPGQVRWYQRLVASPSAVAGLVLLLVMVAIALVGPLFVPKNPYDPANPILGSPSWTNPLGTDVHQRDMMTMVFRGVRVTMTVVVVVVVISSVVGVTLGLVAGYLGGIADEVITRMAEVIQSVPRFFLAFLVIALYGPGLSKIILILCITSWPLLARVVRAEALTIRTRPFVDAARTAGASGPRIVATHLLPNVLPQAIVILVLMGSRVILIEAGLAFLGLGPPGDPSLGVLARNAQEFLRDAWWLSVFPGLAIVATVLGLNLLSDGLSQALDPRGEGRPTRIGRELSA